MTLCAVMNFIKSLSSGKLNFSGCVSVVLVMTSGGGAEGTEAFGTKWVD